SSPPPCAGDARESRNGNEAAGAGQCVERGGAGPPPPPPPPAAGGGPPRPGGTAGPPPPTEGGGGGGGGGGRLVRGWGGGGVALGRERGEVLALVTGAVELVGAGLAGAVALGQRGGAVGRPAGDLVHVEQTGEGVGQADDDHALVQQGGVERGDGHLLAA